MMDHGAEELRFPVPNHQHHEQLHLCSIIVDTTIRIQRTMKRCLHKVIIAFATFKERINKGISNLKV